MSPAVGDALLGGDPSTSTAATVATLGDVGVGSDLPDSTTGGAGAPEAAVTARADGRTGVTAQPTFTVTGLPARVAASTSVTAQPSSTVTVTGIPALVVSTTSVTVSVDLLTARADGRTTLTVTAISVSGGTPLLGTDTPTVHLYDRTGRVWISDLTHARGVTWQHELSKPGAASFEVPFRDAGGIVDRSIVKFSWRGAVRFGCVIRAETTSAAVDGTIWVKFDSQPGLLALENEAVIYPENGLNRRSPSTRAFGYMSLDGPWRVPSEWVTPRAVTWGASGGAHASLPVDFAALDPNARWIGYVSPDTTVGINTVNYFRGGFTLGAAQDVALILAADNFGEVFLDGEVVVAADRLNIDGWRTAAKVTTRLAAGPHLLAAKVENSPFTSSEFGGRNPLGFLCTVLPVDTAGNPIPNAPIRHTDTANWRVSNGTPEPGWSRAWVLGALHAEARARGVRGPRLLTAGFTDSRDSDGTPFTDRGEYAIDVATVGLADVATQLCEADIDVDVDAAAMTLQCFNRKGSDRHATVALALGRDGGSLRAYDMTRTAARFTSVLTQLGNGTWLDTQSGVGAAGLIEVGLNIGSTNSTVTAARIARGQLAESAAALVSVTGESSTLTGAAPYVDYQLGDSITVPGRRGAGTMKARVLSIHVDATGDTVRAWPEFVQDLS